MSANDTFQSCIDYYGNFAGDIFNVYRPNYSIIDNTPVLVYSNLVYRMDPDSPRFSEPKFRDVDWYEIFGDRSILIPGDILKKSVADGGQTPPVTFAHSMPLKAGIGFRSSKICSLTNQFDDPLYTNVYFDWLGSSFPGSSINKKLEDSLKIPTVRAVIFKRDNLFRLRTHLIETDSTNTVTKDGGSPTQFQRKWDIQEIQQTGNFMLLTLFDSTQKD